MQRIREELDDSAIGQLNITTKLEKSRISTKIMATAFFIRS